MLSKNSNTTSSGLLTKSSVGGGRDRSDRSTMRACLCGEHRGNPSTCCGWVPRTARRGLCLAWVAAALRREHDVGWMATLRPRRAVRGGAVTADMRPLVGRRGEMGAVEEFLGDLGRKRLGGVLQIAGEP